MVDKEAEAKELSPFSDDLAQRIQNELGINVFLCYQCVKCTSGCPMAEYFDWQPNQIMRAVQLGQEDIALESKTPWLCAACQTCSTRCPQDLDITAVMEFLTRESSRRGIKSPIPKMEVFTSAFMREINLWGRAFELGLLAEMKLRTLDLVSDLDLGIKMILKGKMAFLPHPTRPPKHVKKLAEAAQSVAYYPGCSLHSTAPELDRSSQEVCEALGINLIEPKGWVCCGSSAAHRVDTEAALRLPMENFAILEKSGFTEVTMPCAMCFNRHKVAQYEVREHDHHREHVEEAVGYSFDDTVRVTSLMETIIDHVGLEGVARQVEKPLEGLKVVCYYGCLLTRPPKATGAKHPENPTEMDDLMAALGAEVLDWSYKTTCCGASHSLTDPSIVLNLSGKLIAHAKKAGADTIVVSCPMCHANLDGRQTQMENHEAMPVLYLTQLVAVALGLSEKAAGLSKNLIDPRPLLHRAGLLP